MIDPITSEQMTSQFVVMEMQNGRNIRRDLGLLTAKHVIADVSRRTGVLPQDLLAQGRGLRHVSQARQECYRILHRDLGHSLPVIGRIMGRDHTSVLHGVKAAEARR